MTHDQVLDTIAHAIHTKEDIAQGRCFCGKHWNSPVGKLTTFNGWDGELAMQTLGIPALPLEDVFNRDFEAVDAAIRGTLNGYTTADGIWLNPDCRHALHTIIHELAHNVLGHIGKIRDKTLSELEAELTTVLVFEDLAIPDGIPAAVGYFGQHYLRNVAFNLEVVLDDRAKLKAAAAKILQAGRQALRKDSGYQSGYYGVRMNVPKAIVEPLNRLDNLIMQAAGEIAEANRSKGQNLLLNLASGEMSLKDFEAETIPLRERKRR